MGACIGKKSSKYSKRNQPQSDITQAPQPKTQDSILQDKSSPSSSKRLPVTDDLLVNSDGECRTSKLNENSIDLELQIILDEQEIINEALSQPFPSRMISATDTELEYELANLMYQHSKNDHVENPPVDTTVKSDKP